VKNEHFVTVYPATMLRTWLAKEMHELRATACKYEESSDRTKILDFFLFHPKNPFGELLSKIVLKSSIALLFLRKIEKLKISDERPLDPPENDGNPSNFE